MGDAWSNYKDLKSSVNQLTLQDIIDMIHAAQVGFTHQRGQKQAVVRGSIKYGAVIAILYLTGSRVSEVFRPSEQPQVKVVNGKTYTYNYNASEGLKFSDMAVNPPDTQKKPNQPQWLTFKLIVRKRQEQFFRVVNVARVDDPSDPYFPIVQAIYTYLDALGFKDEAHFESVKHNLMFSCGSKTIRNMLINNYRINAHFFRHIRASHLMRYHRLTPAELKKFFEWKSEVMPMRYASADVTSINNRLLQFQN